MLAAPERLAPATRKLLTKSANELLLSAASAWEIAIKHGLGKLRLPDAPERAVPELMARTEWSRCRCCIATPSAGRRYPQAPRSVRSGARRPGSDRGAVHSHGRSQLPTVRGEGDRSLRRGCSNPNRPHGLVLQHLALGDVAKVTSACGARATRISATVALMQHWSPPASPRSPFHVGMVVGETSRAVRGPCTSCTLARGLPHGTRLVEVVADGGAGSQHSHPELRRPVPRDDRGHAVRGSVFACSHSTPARRSHRNGEDHPSRVDPRLQRPDRSFSPHTAGEFDRSLEQSQIFGHERGAFTGAVDRHVGVLEEAGDGTLLLDDFHHLRRATQTLLLRVLDRGVFRRLHASRDLRSGVE